MKSLFSSIKRFFKQVRGFFPSPIPVGKSEFEAWAKDISATYDLPTADEDSLRFTLSSIIMHLGPTAAYKPKFYFVVTMRAAAAKQVAGSVFYEIKQQQTERAKLAAASEQQPA